MKGFNSCLQFMSLVGSIFIASSSAFACQYFEVAIGANGAEFGIPRGSSHYVGPFSSSSNYECLDTFSCEEGQDCETDPSKFFGLWEHCLCKKDIRPAPWLTGTNSNVQPKPVKPDATETPTGASSAADLIRKEIMKLENLKAIQPVLLEKNPKHVPVVTQILDDEIDALESLAASPQPTAVSTTVGQ